MPIVMLVISLIGMFLDPNLLKRLELSFECDSAVENVKTVKAHFGRIHSGHSPGLVEF